MDFALVTPSHLTLLPVGAGFLCASLSFDDFDRWESWSNLSPEMRGTIPRFSGMSSLFHPRIDSKLVHGKKVEILDRAVSTHLRLSVLTGKEASFRFMTEPFGEGPRMKQDEIFGEWNYSREFCRAAASHLGSLGISWISISQNQVRSKEIRGLTIDLAEMMNDSGIECSIGWQVWPSSLSSENYCSYLTAEEEASERGVTSFLGEFGVRFSNLETTGVLRETMLGYERNWALSRIAPNLFRECDYGATSPCWWGLGFPEDLRPGGLISMADLSFLTRGRKLR